MRKVIFVLFLVFGVYVSNAQVLSSQDVRRWKSFFGIEGGVGLLDLTPAIINYNLFFGSTLRGLSYGGGIFGGWQRYARDAIGMRNTLGLRAFIAPKTGGIPHQEGESPAEDEYWLKTKDMPTTAVTFYYALDGLFDIIKRGENRFGVSLGFSTDVFRANYGRAVSVGYLIKISPRFGFYLQYENDVFDLVLSSPLFEVAGVGWGAYNSTLSLSYRHLF